MMTLIAAAAFAAQTPAAPSNGVQPMPHGQQHMQMDQGAESRGADCCKDCCKDMAKEHDSHGHGHDGNSGR